MRPALLCPWPARIKKRSNEVDGNARSDKISGPITVLAVSGHWNGCPGNRESDLRTCGGVSRNNQALKLLLHAMQFRDLHDRGFNLDTSRPSPARFCGMKAQAYRDLK